MEIEGFTSESNISEYLSHRPNLERYQEYMDSSQGDKLSHILPHVKRMEHNLKILSIGCGTGKLERAIADIMPTSHIIGLDASVPMLQEIPHQNNHHVESEGGCVTPILANAESIPLRDESIDVIIASSVIHEIVSYRNDFQFKEGLEKFFIEAMRVLKKGGKIIVRDFMQPKDPEGLINVSVGEVKEGDFMDPAEFIEKFAKDFKGDDLSYVASQIEELKQNGTWGRGACLKVRNSHAFEILAHFSWSQSFDEEIKEKYAYLPVKQYAEFIQDALEKASVSSNVVEASTYMQEGYREHIEGRLDLTDQEGQPVELPDFTGIVVIQKQ